jgi:hypothetical protein
MQWCRSQAKFHDSGFDMSCLIELEREMFLLSNSQYSISPLCTPTSFLHLMMDLTGDIGRKETILKNADLLIAEFLGGKTAVLLCRTCAHITPLASRLLHRTGISTVCAFNRRHHRAAAVFLPSEDPLRHAAQRAAYVLLPQPSEPVLPVRPGGGARRPAAEPQGALPGPRPLHRGVPEDGGHAQLPALAHPRLGRLI